MTNFVQAQIDAAERVHTLARETGEPALIEWCEAISALYDAKLYMWTGGGDAAFEDARERCILAKKALTPEQSARLTEWSRA